MNTASRALHRLPLDFYTNPPLRITPTLSSPTPLTSDTHARSLGIVAHELLQWICTHHPLTFEEVPWQLTTHALRREGWHDKDLQIAQTLLKHQFAQLFEDPIGQWLIQRHPEEQNEYALLAQGPHDIVTRIIDRTFCCDGIRWVIDFKTGQNHVEAEQEHREQVRGYARLLTLQHPEPIRCGLYYLSQQHWIHWDHEENL
jgi:ATP-dependent exoDNAse (exonuclease V) beta subunit